MDKKVVLVLAAVAVVLYLLFANRTSAAPVSLATVGAATPGGTGIATAASALTNLENSLGSIFNPSTTGVSAQGIMTATAINKTAGLTTTSAESDYGVAQALTSQSAGAATPIQSGVYSPSLGQDAPIIASGGGSGSFDLNGLLGNSYDTNLASIPPPNPGITADNSPTSGYEIDTLTPLFGTASYT